MIGVELVKPGTKEPNPAAANTALEAARRGGVLVGKGGLFGNVLRIAPPLSLTRQEAEQGHDVLAAALADSRSRGRGRGRGFPLMSRIVIRNGLVITAADEVQADVLVDGDKVVALAATDAGLADTWADGAERVIDASGRYVIPGGVDAHTHMELPFGGTFASDTFETGTRAAAWGGTTTIIDFAVQTPGMTLREGLDAWFGKSEGECAIDYGFHMIIGDVNEQSLKEMDMLVDEGISSFKLFMAYPGVFYSDDGQILRAMQRAAANSGLIMMHAENGIAIDVLIAQALERGQTDPKYHGVVRHKLLEAEATHRAIQLARVAGAPVYIVHLSAAEALAEVAAAPRHRFQRVRRDLPAVSVPVGRRPGPTGFRGGEVRVLDPAAAGRAPGRPVGRAAHQRPVGGVDRPLPLLLQGAEGARTGRLLQDPQRAARSGDPDGPAPPGGGRRAHLPPAVDRDRLHHAGEDVRALPPQGHGRPGRRCRHRHLRPGRHPDAVGRDPPHERRLLLLRGPRITGHVDTVLSRGKVVIDGGEYLGSKGDGRFLARGPCQYLM